MSTKVCVVNRILFTCFAPACCVDFEAPACCVDFEAVEPVVLDILVD